MMMNKITTYLRYLLLILFIAIVAWVIYYFFFVQRISASNIEQYINQYGALAPLAYMVLYIIAVVLFLPTSVFSIAGGFLFGKLFGTLYVVIAATLAASIGFFMARYLGKDISFWIEKRNTKLMKKIEQYCGEKTFRTFFLLRSLFIPYMPLTYAAGLVKNVHFSGFVLATLATNSIFSFAFVYFGEQLRHGPTALILPAILIAVLFLVPRMIRKFSKRRWVKEL